MSEYLHGAYGAIQATGTRVANESLGAIIYVGTAPVHLIEGGAANVNKAILVRNMAEARKYFGYSDDWAKYTLCEAMKVHLEDKGVGPLILINVLDPATHRASTDTTVTKTPENGRVVIASAEDVVIDTLTVKIGSTTKTKGVDYGVSYNFDKQTLTIAELTEGALGDDELTITYKAVEAEDVDAEDVIGSSDGMGLNTGLFCVKNVYQETGYIPAYLGVPGWSGNPAVHAAMLANSRKINKHWDAYLFVDIPITSDGTAITLNTAKTWKDANGYNAENETVYFPLAEGTDGKTYHLSVLAAANFQALLLDQSGIPFKTASNTEAGIIKNLYLGASYTGRVYDDELINEKLNKNGIASAAYVGGQWVIWGAHSADYDQSNANPINVSETSRMMLYYISNDFQHRRSRDVDKPMTANDLKSIVSEEQTRLDALLSIGALTYGKVAVNADAEARSDIMNGDFSFVFDITTTPLAKSLTAIVNWTDEGFVTYFENLA